MSEPNARTSTSKTADDLVFEKYEGLRNDFLIIDERNGAGEPSLSLEERIALCDRHAGVGSDGVLTLLPARTKGAVARMHVTNSDGSVPEMCGNGLRCVSRWLIDHDVVTAGAHSIDTDAGTLACFALDDGRVRVTMRGATLDDACVGAPLVDEEVSALEHRFLATAVSVGNPHLVLRAPADEALARRVGPVLEHHQRFPARTNVEFATLRSRHEMDLVVWERGAGFTQACGTGATAAVAAFVHAGECPADDDVLVHLPGGDLVVRVARDLARIEMTGPARRVFVGRIAHGGKR